MKIFAIRDESAADQIDLAYLLYYEMEKRFYIELPENADPWETPLLLSSFVKNGETSINSYWSKMWVQQRIVPTDQRSQAVRYRSASPSRSKAGKQDQSDQQQIHLEWQRSSYAHHLLQIISQILSCNA